MFKIDLVSPPFAGHLFPLLEMGQCLQQQGFRIRVLSTTKAIEAISLSKLEHVPLLVHRDAAIEAIANPPYQVKNNPRFLLRQFEGNLALMKELRFELETIWLQDKPDLVLADFTLPLAGLLAQELGIEWWTSLPTPCALETTGTPSYLGGWRPGSTPFHFLRDAVGRTMIRGFKQVIALKYRKALSELNIASLYQPNGEEIVYSPQRILALGISEFEFECDWPEPLRFIGPLIASPPFKHSVPSFEAGKKHIFVSLGTHIPWAKERALQLTRELAHRLPEYNFHFSYGQAGQEYVHVKDNLSLYGYIPYDLYLHHYAVAIIHGGTGITYSCIKAGVPMLVWPHDYDQFDHAARIVHHGLGLKINGQLESTLQYLQELLTNQQIQDKTQVFQQKLEAYQPHQWVLQELTKKNFRNPIG
jgi:UDP:flavonoid glycosyltransferase YjiC (YdhE family)